MNLNRLLVYMPRPLPVGLTDFNSWSDRIIALSGNFADADSMKFALASNVMHLPSQTAWVSDMHFIRAMRKAAANQVAAQVFQDVKLKQEAARLAAQTAKQSEATDNQVVASDVSQNEEV